MINKEQYDALVKRKNRGLTLDNKELKNLNEYESTTLKEKGDKYIPPTSYGDLNYADIMRQLNKSASTPEDIEKFKSMLADKIMHDESFNVVKFARMVKLGDDKNGDGQYSYEEIIRSPDFQRFLTDMQAQSQKEQIAKDVDKELRYSDSDTDEDRPWYENLRGGVTQLAYPITVEKIKRGGFLNNNETGSAPIALETAVNAAELLPISIGTSAIGKVVSKVAPQLTKNVIAKAISSLLAGGAIYGAGPIARSAVEQNQNRQNFSTSEFASDAAKGTVFNYAAPKFLTQFAGPIAEKIPIVKKAIDRATSNKQINRDLEDVIQIPSKAKPITSFGQTKQERQFINKAKKVGAAFPETDSREAVKGIYKDALIDLRNNSTPSEYLSFMDELKAKNNRFVDKLREENFNTISTELAKKDVPITYKGVFDKNGELNVIYKNKLKNKNKEQFDAIDAERPKIKDIKEYTDDTVLDFIKKEEEKGKAKDELLDYLTKTSADEIPEVNVALRAPRNKIDEFAQKVSQSDPIEAIANVLSRYGINKISSSDKGADLAESVINFLPGTEEKETPDIVKKNKADKSGRSYKGDTNNIQAIQKARDERWADGFATFAEKNTPEYQTWLAENIKHLADY